MGQQPQTRREMKEAQRGRGWVVPALVGVLAVVAGGILAVSYTHLTLPTKA